MRPFNQNLQIQWDPELANTTPKFTGEHGNNVMPQISLPIDIEEESKEDIPLPAEPKTDVAILKPDYTNPGLDTSTLTVPAIGPVTRSKSKLKLDNNLLPMDESIKTFTRLGKKTHKEMKYKKLYIPPETPPKPHEMPQTNRRSKRLETKWEASKDRAVHFTNVENVIILPSCIQATSGIGLKDVPLKYDQAPPLTPQTSHERLRAYHSRIDLLRAVIHPEQSDFDWQVKDVLNWILKKDGKRQVIMLKVSWFGGDKQWITMDNARLHDLFLVIRYALKNKLTKNPGWEWTKHYMDSDKILNHIIHVYKSSRFLKKIKFGIEVPQSTRHAISMDAAEKNDL